MRGFAILLVIYSHIVYFSFEIETTLISIFSTIHMPIFFFISGLVVKKWQLGSFPEYRNILSKRFVQLVLFPSLVGLLYSCFILKHSAIEYATETMKYGYWFTLSLFSMYVLLFSITLLVNKLTIKSSNTNIILGLLCVVTIILWLGIYLFENSQIYSLLANTICLRQTSLYLPFFCLGLYVQLNLQSIKTFLNKKSLLISMLLFMLFTIINEFYISDIESLFSSVPVRGLMLLLIGFTGVSSIFLLFNHLSWLSSGSSLLGRMLVHVGTNTLTIYLFHYFFLSLFTFIGCYVRKDGNGAIDLSIGVASTLLLIWICLTTKYILEKLMTKRCKSSWQAE